MKTKVSISNSPTESKVLLQVNNETLCINDEFVTLTNAGLAFRYDPSERIQI